MVTKNWLLIVFILLVIISSCKKEDKSASLNSVTFSKQQEALIDSIRLYMFSNPDKAIPFINDFKEISQKKQQNENVKMAYACLGVVYDIKNDVSESLKNNYIALSLCKTSNCIIEQKLTIADIYQRRYKYSESLILLEESKALAKKENNIEYYNLTQRTIALINCKIGAPEKAVEILESVYENVKKGEDDRLIRTTRRDLVEVYLKNNQLEVALKYIEIGLLDAKSVNNQELLYNLYRFQADAYIQAGKFQEAEYAAKETLLNAKILDNDQSILEANYLLALINKKQKRLENAISVLATELKSNTTELPEILSKSYKLLAELYSNKGNNKMSSLYYKKHSVEEKKIEKKRISVLNKTHAISVEELNNAKIAQERKKWYWFSAFAVLLCASVIIYIKNKNTQKINKKRFDDLMLKVNAHEKNNRAVNTIENKEEVVDVNNEGVDEASPNYIIDDERVNEILLKLKTLEEQQYFLRQDCTLHNMAKRLKTNTSYLSKIVNKHLDKTFSNYINELRVNYAIIELKQNKQLRAYSTKAIAQELGYKKANSFSKYFKQATGITPAVYIKNIKELSKNDLNI